jgi:hypothetical protein
MNLAQTSQYVRIHPNANPQFVIGRTVQSKRVIEAFRHKHDMRKKQLILAGESLHKSDIDIGWLEAASDTYKISADPRDYILTDIPIVTVDIPNRNMQAFPYEEVSYFDPLMGRLVYSTFTSKPTHLDHDNKDPLKAKGVIFDSTLQYVPAFNVWKIRILAGWDCTKDSWLANQIIQKKRSGYSMGALVNSFVCSVCGKILEDSSKCPCSRKGKGAVTSDSHLVYQNCTGVNFIENSSVDDPADITADTDSIWG